MGLAFLCVMLYILLMTNSELPTQDWENIPIVRSREQLPDETDLIMVLGKNLSFEWTAEKVRRSPDHLSTESSIITQTAGMLYRPGRTILLSGGYTIGPGYESQPEAAKRYLLKKFPAIPERDVMIDDSGSDSEKSAQYLSQLVKTGAYNHIALLTVGYHHDYASLLYGYYKAPIESYIAAEDVFAEQTHLRENFIRRWRESQRIQREFDYAAKKRATILDNLTHGRDPLGDQERARLQERVAHLNKPSDT